MYIYKHTKKISGKLIMYSSKIIIDIDRCFIQKHLKIKYQKRESYFKV